MFLPSPTVLENTWLVSRILYPVHSLWQLSQNTQTGGRGGEVMQVAKTFVQVCARNYPGAKFIAPSQGPIPGSIPVLGPTGDWGGYLHWSYGSTTSQPQLRYGFWHNHVLVKRVPRVFSLWVESNLWVPRGPSSQECHPLRIQTDKNVPIAHGSS